MNLYIVRHGETDWNTEKRIQGQTDIELNENGVRLAELTSEGLKDVEFDCIFSSPLKRAYKTAEIIRGERTTEIVRDDRLKEMFFGKYEGTTKADRPADCCITTLFKDPGNYVAEGGAESLEHLAERAAAFLEEHIFPAEATNPDAKILLIGHGALNKALMSCLMHWDKKDFWGYVQQKNCTVTIVGINGGHAEFVEPGKVFY
ncbi:MAG: histidine phosphatase family protein [Lachnospiraceae bacterium]|nr:histidine phosphatase family protein [Lachnospiraceae bacterium]